MEATSKLGAILFSVSRGWGQDMAGEWYRKLYGIRSQSRVHVNISRNQNPEAVKMGGQPRVRLRRMSTWSKACSHQGRDEQASF